MTTLVTRTTGPLFGRVLVYRCPSTGRLTWFAHQMTETVAGQVVTWTECRHCWHGSDDLHATVKNEPSAGKGAGNEELTDGRPESTNHTRRQQS